MKTYVSLFVLAATLSYALTPIVIRYATSRGFLDRPDESRRSHTRPVPRLGGVAIYLSFVLTLASLVLVDNLLTFNLKMHYVELLKLLAPCTVVFLLGYMTT